MPRKLPVPLEKDIQKQILQYLALTKILIWRTNSGGARLPAGGGKTQYVRFNTAEGCSDLTGILPDGRFLAIEVKRPGEKPTELQQGFLDKVTTQGGLALVVSSVEELRLCLKGEGYDVP